MRSVRLSLIFILLLWAAVAMPAMGYPASTAIKVTVLNSDGSPAGGVHVTLQNGNYAVLGNGTTDATGACAFTVSPGSSVVRAIVSDGEYSLTSVWHDTNDTAILVRLPEVGVVSGSIKLDGMGRGNPLVVLDDARAFDSTPYEVSRQNGSSMYTFTVNRFSFTTSKGEHSIYAVGYSDGMVYMSDRLDINVTEKEDVVLELKPAGENTSILPAVAYERLFHTTAFITWANVSGTLMGADGRPVANASLTIQDYFMKDQGVTRTDANGAFAFGPLNLSTDVVRFRADIVDNGTEYVSYSRLYPVENSTSLKVNLTDYPRPTVGYIYGIITPGGNSSSPTPISGTVYLSNGMVQEASPDKNNGQFFFTVAPGTYEIYAEHVEGARRLVSDRVSVEVKPAWSPLAASPTILVVAPQKIQYLPLFAALIIGAFCIAGMWQATRRWL
ncbi:hypothetical protein Mtc_0018 [Methanocella conradii HZ254]|uniref:Carboxypeptidase regulatory-like domain-containing protein n=1 Tax=Methanocella conradii (strain DSM 24694 / JCM 17849 / CGMCC 1.5162 / HZ254) TaxID=1041930 RepID=H8I599_METCZ|nr:carboxypeptidase regulatory-like domain-containing protein [Methanocella conradii]AFC98793.1 hypothetical protein Mtc_0018 [Methanocella conradii HZ254]